MSLAELQSQFEAALRGAPGDHARILAEIVPAGRLTASGALDVYGKSYRARLTSALGEIYETVWRAMGDDLFFHAAAQYIAEHPSTTHSLQFYGVEFPAFLERLLQRPEAADTNELPGFLPDLARFEWLFAELFHKRTETGLTGSSLAEAVESGRPLSLIDSAFLFESHWAVDVLFSSRSQETLPDNVERPCWLVSYKISDSIAVEPVSQEAFHVLAGISRGLPVHEVLAKSNASQTEIQTLFAHISTHGLLKAQGGDALAAS